MAAPYIASPDLKRFWAQDIRVARKANQSTIRRKGSVRGANEQEDLAYDIQARNLGGTLEKALREALDDATFKKVKRMSYSANAAKGVRDRLGIPEGSSDASSMGPNQVPKSNEDLMLLDKLVSNLLENNDSNNRGSASSGGLRNSIINRFRPLSRSLRLGSVRRNQHMPTILESNPSSPTNNQRSSHSVLQTIRNAPQRFSQQDSSNKEENSSLTKNILD